MNLLLTDKPHFEALTRFQSLRAGIGFVHAFLAHNQAKWLSQTHVNNTAHYAFSAGVFFAGYMLSLSGYALLLSAAPLATFALFLLIQNGKRDKEHTLSKVSVNSYMATYGFVFRIYAGLVNRCMTTIGTICAYFKAIYIYSTYRNINLIATLYPGESTKEFSNLYLSKANDIGRSWFHANINTDFYFESEQVSHEAVDKAYDFFGLAHDAEAGEIKTAYRKFAKIHHTDRSGGNNDLMSEANHHMGVLRKIRPL